jgi:predicted DNA-binding helix-hairpin-helix protein
MDINAKLESLSQSAALDCEGPPTLTREQRKAQFIAHSRHLVTHPQRGKMPVMRIMQTSACERNCYYCPFQAGRNYRRVTLAPTELAASFHQMQQKKLVDGLFLSSGIIGGGVTAMDRLVDTVEIVRRKYGYRGYVHLKIMPGADTAQIARAAQLANRLSINLEGANERRLAKLAPKKDFWQELVGPLQWLRQIRRKPGPWTKSPSLTTQFVVGPSGESDQELLASADNLYQNFDLGRAYYSAFNPIEGTTFENMPKTPALREHRLYQADWLLRFYGFKLDELPFDGRGNLALDKDPKAMWAKAHLSQRPVEINYAKRGELLRIPGIGPKTADAIITARRIGSITELAHLKQLGVPATRAAPYILLNGRRPVYQLPLVESSYRNK